jgi:Zn-dependent peptidase ImmA (M78 family)/transcriptional regulator with XRE-family HTH domain
MLINGQMIVLAREIRGLSQEELARRIMASQATVARIEGTREVDVQDARVEQFSRNLGFPVSFFQLQEDLLGFGSSAYYYRKRTSLSASDRKRIHGIVNVLRINIKKMLDTVEVVPKRKLPLLDVAEYGSATRVAHTLRSFWHLPDGPINNVTSLIESAGVIVVPCDFGAAAMDATSLRLAEMPPLIFISMSIPGDRWRFTLAHELAHLVMHEVPHERMEDEADEFAAELLLPSLEMKAFFSRLSKIRLVDLINVKPYWKVSVAALIERAHNLGFINPNTRRYLWATLKKLGYPNEPQSLQREAAKNHQNMVSYFTKRLGFKPEDLAAMFHISRQDLGFLHGPSAEQIAAKPGHLRAVR